MPTRAMYSENPPRDALLFVRASITNLLAVFPFYLRIGNRSGRGRAHEPPAEAAAYFRRCIDDYCAELGVDKAWLRDKRVLEYGPGNMLGVALLLYAYGAKSVTCVDQFPIYRLTPEAVGVYRALLESLDGAARARAERAFVVPGDPASGFDPAAIEYRVTPRGLCNRPGAYDLVLSRSVLALVGALDETMRDIAASLAPGGVSIHKVDLSSHGLDRDRPLDFLTWPTPLYRLMYSRKGRPNRWRADRYQSLAAAAGLRIRKIAPTGKVSDDDVAFIRTRVDEPFKQVPLDLLSWLGFWMILECGSPST